MMVGNRVMLSRYGCGLQHYRSLGLRVDTLGEVIQAPECGCWTVKIRWSATGKFFGMRFPKELLLWCNRRDVKHAGGRNE